MSTLLVQTIYNAKRYDFDCAWVCPEADHDGDEESCPSSQRIEARPSMMPGKTCDF